MTTDRSIAHQSRWRVFRALAWKTWVESRGRFFATLALLIMLVVYAVLTAPDYLARHNSHFPDKPLFYSVYVWSGLFHYALQGLWMLAAFVLALGGLAREKAAGVALYTLGLPVKRLHLFLLRAGMAWVESLALAVICALLIPLFSSIAGESYPLLQALAFGLLMGTGGLVILTVGLLFSELFEGEFTAPVAGLCAISAVFFGYKARTIPGWNVFDAMSGAAYIDPQTQLWSGGPPWQDLLLCMAVSLGLLCASAVVVRLRDV